MSSDDGQLHCARCGAVLRAGAMECAFCGCSPSDTDVSVVDDPPTWQERCYLACAVLLILQGIGLIVFGAVALNGQLVVYIAGGGLLAIAAGVGLIRLESWAQILTRVLGLIATISAFRMAMLSGLNLQTYPDGPVVLGASLALLAFWAFLIWLTFAVSE